MTARYGTLLLCAASALAGASLPERAAGAAEPARAAAFDPSRPESWGAAVAEIKREEAAMAESLLAVAEDENQETQTRREAVFALSKLRTPRAIRFFIRNVSLELPGPAALTVEQQVKERPCDYALSEGRDWGTARAIVFGLDETARPPADLMGLASNLEVILGRPVAIAAVDLALGQRDPVAPQNARLENLTAIKKYLQPK